MSSVTGRPIHQQVQCIVVGLDSLGSQPSLQEAAQRLGT